MSSEKAITHGESVIGQMDGGLQGKRRQAKACFGRAKIRSKNWARAPTLRHTERLDLTAETERVKWYAVFCGLFQRATVLVSRQGLWTCARSTTRREAALLRRCSPSALAPSRDQARIHLGAGDGPEHQSHQRTLLHLTST